MVNQYELIDRYMKWKESQLLLNVSWYCLFTFLYGTAFSPLFNEENPMLIIIIIIIIIINETSQRKNGFKFLLLRPLFFPVA